MIISFNTGVTGRINESRETGISVSANVACAT